MKLYDISILENTGKELKKKLFWSIIEKNIDINCK